MPKIRLKYETFTVILCSIIFINILSATTIYVLCCELQFCKLLCFWVSIYLLCMQICRHVFWHLLSHLRVALPITWPEFSVLLTTFSFINVFISKDIFILIQWFQANVCSSFHARIFIYLAISLHIGSGS